MMMSLIREGANSVKKKEKKFCRCDEKILFVNNSG
jgi:hypothetical protein